MNPLSPEPPPAEPPPENKKTPVWVWILFGVVPALCASLNRMLPPPLTIAIGAIFMLGLALANRKSLHLVERIVLGIVYGFGLIFVVLGIVFAGCVALNGGC